jgi:hypothetical protein
MSMRLFSYVVARDYGFAPNPFFGFCTLATCKPRIRKAAMPGDWVVGTGSREVAREGYLVYAMLVGEAMSFNEYWADPRFQRKRPNLRGSKKQAFGDNIYFKDGAGVWQQLDSHHSLVGGAPNPVNVKHDTQTDRVLIGEHFAYCGGSGPSIPAALRHFQGLDICARRNHKSRFREALIAGFVAWFHSLNAQGFCGAPLDWCKTP